jgi:hypothetical protein
VVEKVRMQSLDYLDRFEERLWRLTRYLLAPYARFTEREYSFTLERNPFPGETIHPGPYRMGKNVEDANTYRVGHPLAQRLLAQAKALAVRSGDVNFRYSESGKHIAILESLRGKSGWLTCTHVTVCALETEDHLILAGMTESGEVVDDSQCRRLFDLPGEEKGAVSLPTDTRSTLEDMTTRQIQEFLDATATKNGMWFEAEMEKLDHWAEDRRASLKAELDELDETIKETKKAARLAPNLPDKLERQRAVRHLESKRTEAWKVFDEASREIERQKDAILDEISRRLEQRIEQEPLFTIRWSV